jgi:retron-type reverse transcriptase
MSNIPLNTKKRARYDGQVEYRAVQAEVKRMLGEGHRVRAIFDEMSRSGKITISYSTFCAYVRGGGQRPRKGTDHDQNQKRPGLRHSQPAKSGRRVADPNGPFFYDKDIDISELV